MLQQVFRVLPAAALLTLAVQAQTVPAARKGKPPAFEAATIKRELPNGGPPVIGPYGTSHFSVTNAPLEFLLELAFGMEESRISGAPAWTYNERYDIDAKAEDGVILSYEQVQPRLQRLLRQRLKLATHRETKEVDGYWLEIAAGGSKLRASSGGSVPGKVLLGELEFRNISMPAFASILASPTGRPVIDKTGLQGHYDIDVKFAPPGTKNSLLPSFFAALEQQLGLKLEPQRVALEILVIDHLQQEPTAN